VVGAGLGGPREARRKLLVILLRERTGRSPLLEAGRDGAALAECATGEAGRLVGRRKDGCLSALIIVGWRAAGSRSH
jgi:hypothetical protein